TGRLGSAFTACLDEAMSEANVRRSLERETGIEPATNSLEGCDSTTELLPPTRSPHLPPRASAGKPTKASHSFVVQPCRRANRPRYFPDPSLACTRSSRSIHASEGYGEGRTRTFEATRATDLQSAAFDRFATSPTVCVLWKRDVFLNAFSSMELAKGFEPPTC